MVAAAPSKREQWHQGPWQAATVGFPRAVHVNHTNYTEFTVLFDKQQQNNTYGIRVVLKLSVSRPPKTQRISLKPVKKKSFYHFCMTRYKQTV